MSQNGQVGGLMTVDPQRDSAGLPTPADASRILAEIGPVTRPAQRLTRDGHLGLPLLAWGLAWLAGALLFQCLPGPAGPGLGLAACAAAAVLTRLVRPREGRP